MLDTTAHLAGHVLDCSRPMVFESEIQDDPAAGIVGDDFRCYVGATSFLCRWRGRSFAVTAGHAIKNVPDERIFIFARDDATRSLGFATIWRPGRRSEFDFTDIALFELANHGENDAELRGVFLPELAGFTAHTLQLSDRFIVSGYPNEKRVVDYERRLVPQQRYLLPASYVTASAPNVHVVDLDSSADLSTFGGLSGSPVFVVRDRLMHFAGMVIRGSHNTQVSRRLHFIAGPVIQAALTLACRER